MKSSVLPSFWICYSGLDDSIRSRARKAYRLWLSNPFHPSLHFKCLNSENDIWSARITKGYRALGILDKDTVVWYWIGAHDEYVRQIVQ